MSMAYVTWQFSEGLLNASVTFGMACGVSQRNDDKWQYLCQNNLCTGVIHTATRVCWRTENEVNLDSRTGAQIFLVSEYWLLTLCVHTKNMGSDWNPCLPKGAVTLQLSLQWFSDPSHLLSVFFQPRWRTLINLFLLSLCPTSTQRENNIDLILWPPPQLALKFKWDRLDTSWSTQLYWTQLQRHWKPLSASVLAAIISTARAQWRYCIHLHSTHSTGDNELCLPQANP